MNGRTVAVPVLFGLSALRGLGSRPSAVVAASAQWHGVAFVIGPWPSRGLTEKSSDVRISMMARSKAMLHQGARYRRARPVPLTRSSLQRTNRLISEPPRGALSWAHSTAG